MSVECDFPLAILAKAPLPGRVKTRLIPRLGAAGAAALHEALLRQTLETAVAATAPASITLWTALEHRHDFFRQCRSHFGIRLRPQPRGDLGARMHAALAAMPRPGLLIGSDCAMLDAALLQRCQAALAMANCVLLPAEDGGYALVGMQRADRRLFADIDWGSERVMVQTRSRIATLGWTCACPATVWDIDRPEDLDRLATLPNAAHWQALIDASKR